LEFLRSNGLRLVEDYRWQPITNRWLERWDVPHGGPEPRTWTEAPSVRPLGSA